MWKDDKPLFCAAIRKFGNWHTALRAAGIEPRPFRKWSPERVIDGLCAEYRHAPCVIRRVDPALAGAAYRLFGSVALALDAAGLDPPPGRWTPGRVIEQIQDGHVQGRPLHKAGLGDKRLARAAKRYFGHWRTAVAAAGLAAQLPPANKTRVWSPQAVIDEILDWHRRGLRLTELWETRHGTLFRSKKTLRQLAGRRAGRRFGNDSPAMESRNRDPRASGPAPREDAA